MDGSSLVANALITLCSVFAGALITWLFARQIVREAHERAERDAAAAAMWQARAAFLAGQLAEAQQRILALAGPKEEAISAPAAAVEPASRPVASLWSRLMGWFGG